MLRDKKACSGESIDTTEQPEVTTVTPLVVRHKGETNEEKQARKHLVKQHNKVCDYNYEMYFYRKDGRLKHLRVDMCKCVSMCMVYSSGGSGSFPLGGKLQIL